MPTVERQRRRFFAVFAEGDVKRLEKMIRKDPAIMYYTDGNGRNGLMLASIFGKVKEGRAMLGAFRESGLDIRELVKVRDRMGADVDYYADAFGKTDFVEMLRQEMEKPVMEPKKPPIVSRILDFVFRRNGNAAA